MPKASTLVDKQRWSKLLLILTDLTASAETLQKSDWKVYFNSRLFGGAPPEQRRQTIVQALPENAKALERYTLLYRRFNQYRNAVPSTVEALHEVHTCSTDLAGIQFVESCDVPAAVSAFFNATSTAIGASLDFLTPEVIAWLQENHMLASFVVRAR